MNIQDIYENEMFLEARGEKRKPNVYHDLETQILSLWHLASPFSGLIRR